jgi:hypothetical protein
MGKTKKSLMSKFEKKNLHKKRSFGKLTPFMSSRKPMQLIGLPLYKDIALAKCLTN